MISHRIFRDTFHVHLLRYIQVFALLAVVAIGILGYISIQNSQQLINDVVQNGTKFNSHAKKIQHEMLLQRRYEKDFLLSIGDKELQASYLNLIQHSSKLLKSHVSHLQSLVISTDFFTKHIPQQVSIEAHLNEAMQRNNNAIKTNPIFLKKLESCTDARKTDLFIRIIQLDSHYQEYIEGFFTVAKQIQQSSNITPKQGNLMLDPYKDNIRQVEYAIDDTAETGDLVLTQIRDQALNQLEISESRVLTSLISSTILLILVGVISEMFKQKVLQSDKKIHENEARYHFFAEAMSESVVLHKDGKVVDVNQQTLSMFGYTREEIIGLDIILLGEASSRNTIMKNLRINYAKPYSALGLRKDGSTFHGEILSRNVMFEGKPIRVALVRDISEFIRIQQENVHLEAHVQQKQKMEAIGTLAGGIAHDFNNILYGAMGFTELALSELDEDSIAANCLKETNIAHKRATKLVKQILTFSRQDQIDRKPMHVEDAIDEVLKFIRSTFPKNIQIEKKITPNCYPILADATQMHQIILNLCTNAYHAMKNNGGTLQLKLRNINIGNSHINTDLPVGKYTYLGITDTGVGMNEDTKRRVFDPFFTTKKVGEGTGLGLSTVLGIIETYEGIIQVDSVLDKGTTFHLYFPVHIEETPHSPPQKGSESAQLGHERILFVDDEEQIIRLNELTLTEMGYQLVSQTSSNEALALFRKNPHDFDIVVTDYNMPDKTGLEMAKEILRLRPDIPIILCTGFCANISKKEVLSVGINAFVNKPISAQALSQVIRQVIDDNLPTTTNKGNNPTC
ncbi:MAG: hypothetical protein COA42_22395 [Alteromonadaceae bacterium]|nr:MAG: hypothetical protein COA42_22395 [Alteromonadaceae bacterium]